MEMNNKLMPSNKRTIAMIETIYNDEERTIFKGSILRETSKGWYTKTEKKMLFEFPDTALELGAIYSLEVQLASDTTYDSLYQVLNAKLVACASYAAMFPFCCAAQT